MVFRKQDEDQLTESLIDFEITAMLAGLPEGWVQLYGSVLGSLSLILQADGAEAQETQELRKIMQFLARELTTILADATWNPWRTRLCRWYLVRRYREVYTAIHVSLFKGLTAINGWDTTEQAAEYFEFPTLNRKRQRELIRFSKSKSREHFIGKPPNDVQRSNIQGVTSPRERADGGESAAVATE
jgi:hypothetical protein